MATALKYNDLNSKKIPRLRLRNRKGRRHVRKGISVISSGFQALSKLLGVRLFPGMKDLILEIHKLSYGNEYCDATRKELSENLGGMGKSTISRYLVNLQKAKLISCEVIDRYERRITLHINPCTFLRDWWFDDIEKLSEMSEEEVDKLDLFNRPKRETSFLSERNIPPAIVIHSNTPSNFAPKIFSPSNIYKESPHFPAGNVPPLKRGEGGTSHDVKKFSFEMEKEAPPPSPPPDRGKRSKIKKFRRTTFEDLNPTDEERIEVERRYSRRVNEKKFPELWKASALETLRKEQANGTYQTSQWFQNKKDNERLVKTGEFHQRKNERRAMFQYFSGRVLLMNGYEWVVNVFNCFCEIVREDEDEYDEEEDEQNKRKTFYFDWDDDEWTAKAVPVLKIFDKQVKEQDSEEIDFLL
jgi:DNA-binding transcriptional ArsR family regulator